MGAPGPGFTSTQVSACMQISLKMHSLDASLLVVIGKQWDD